MLAKTSKNELAITRLGYPTFYCTLYIQYIYQERLNGKIHLKCSFEQGSSVQSNQNGPNTSQTSSANKGTTSENQVSVKTTTSRPSNETSNTNGTAIQELPPQVGSVTPIPQVSPKVVQQEDEDTTESADYAESDTREMVDPCSLPPDVGHCR
jgi:hypothetical protein